MSILIYGGGILKVGPAIAGDPSCCCDEEPPCESVITWFFDDPRDAYMPGDDIDLGVTSWSINPTSGQNGTTFTVSFTITNNQASAYNSQEIYFILTGGSTFTLVSTTPTASTPACTSLTGSDSLSLSWTNDYAIGQSRTFTVEFSMGTCAISQDYIIEIAGCGGPFYRSEAIGSCSACP